MSGKIIRLWFLLLLMPFAVRAQDLNEELLAAARKSNAEAVKALLAKGADVNAKTRYGATALSFACDRGSVEVVKTLLEHGADVNVRDTFYGATPLVWAADKGHVEIVRMLIDKGAKGKEGALMTGVRENNAALVKTVLETGGIGELTLTSALATATKNNNAEIIELLKKAGAQPPPQVDADTLKSYAGLYKNEQGTEFEFTVKDGRLVGGPKGQNPFSMTALDKTTFKIGEFDVTVTFSVEAGKVTGFTVNQGGTTSSYKRVEAQ
ncbi:MAG TPA: ankyrin repeat domain-containing protein [Blastocatellia bacterium]|nr:ankyrin repeat domain-containing protein [Blastocatellia bacterium]